MQEAGLPARVEPIPSSELAAPGAPPRLLDPAQPSTPAPRGCHTGGRGCATVSPPWATDREAT